MGVTFFGDQLEDGFVIERGLAGFFKPRFAEWLESGKIVGSDGVSREWQCSQKQALARGGIQHQRFGQPFASLKRENGRAGLRADDAVERPG